jgi:hypothetical protein
MVFPYAAVETFCSIDPTEIDCCRLILDDTDRIYFSTMMNDYGEVFATFKGGGSGSLLRIGRSKWYFHTLRWRLFVPLTPLNSIASFAMTPIGSTSVRWLLTTVKNLRRSRAGVVLSQLQIGLFSTISSGSNSGYSVNF